MKAAVLGAGSWGTTFAQVLCDAGTDTVLYARKPQLAKAIAGLHENPDYLPGVALTAALDATSDPAEALDGADLVAFAVPAQSLRSNLLEWAPLLPRGALLVSLMKGIELGSRLRMSEVIAEVTGPELAGPAAERIAVVAGPNLAGEIVRREFTASVVACVASEGALALQGACHTPYFRPYTNTDVTGCELGGAVKNVIAIAVGIAVAMGLGDNTRATLITRGLAEIARLGSALGAQTQTFAGLAGMGDLIATCASPQSRNRHVGYELGRGRALDEVVSEMNMVAEGVKTTAAVLELAARHGVEMPVASFVGRVLYEGAQPADLVPELMLRKAKPELQGMIRRHE